MSTNQSSKYLSVKEAAAHSGKSVSTVRKWIREGKVETKPKEKRTSKVMILRSSLMGFLMTEAEPTVEGAGQPEKVQKAESEELIELRRLVESLQIKIQALEQKSEIDTYALSVKQQLITDLQTTLSTRDAEILSLKGDYQRVSEDKDALTTRINQLTIYIALPWWQRMRSTYLLEVKD